MIARIASWVPKHGAKPCWIIVIFALAVSGCSRFKLLYSFGSEAIESEVSYFLDLNEDEQMVEARLRRSLRLASRSNVTALCRFSSPNRRKG